MRRIRPASTLLTVNQSAAATRIHRGRSLRKEAPGYLAAIAFLAAYLLLVAGSGRILQAALNLAGSGLATSYLWRKRAMPNVLLNVAWAVITVAGLIGLSGKP
jgi:hypothetical protein